MTPLAIVLYRRRETTDEMSAVIRWY